MNVTAAPVIQGVTREVAWQSQSTWRRGHFAPKSAPHHRDFGAGKVGVN